MAEVENVEVGLILNEGHDSYSERGPNRENGVIFKEREAVSMRASEGGPHPNPLPKGEGARKRQVCVGGHAPPERLGSGVP